MIVVSTFVGPLVAATTLSGVFGGAALPFCTAVGVLAIDVT
jgi:hypothetical protein